MQQGNEYRANGKTAVVLPFFLFLFRRRSVSYSTPHVAFDIDLPLESTPPGPPLPPGAVLSEGGGQRGLGPLKGLKLASPLASPLKLYKQE